MKEFYNVGEKFFDEKLNKTIIAVEDNYSSGIFKVGCSCCVYEKVIYEFIQTKCTRKDRIDYTGIHFEEVKKQNNKQNDKI